MQSKRAWIILFIGIFTLILCSLLNLIWGQSSLNWSEIWLNKESSQAYIIFNEIRLPKAITALIAGAAQLVFLYNFINSIFYGKKAEQNPWRSNTMEWTTPVEHMHGNWPGAIPEVHRWAYDYSKPGQEEDFVSQIVPLKEGEEELQH